MKEKMGKKGIIKRLLSVALAVALVVGMMHFIIPVSLLLLYRTQSLR